MARNPIPETVRSRLAAVPLLAIAAVASAAQDRAVEVVSLERLKFEKKCVFEIQEWQGKGAEEIFLQRLEAQRAAYTAKTDNRLPQLIDLVVEILWGKHEQLAVKGDHDQASVYAARVLKTGKNEVGESAGGDATTAILVKADTYVVNRNFAQAEAALLAGKPDEAKAAFKVLLNSSKKTEALAAIIDIDRKATDFERSKAGDVDEQIDGLDRFAAALEASLGSAEYDEIKDLRAQKSKLEGNTQVATVSSIDTAGAVAGVKIGKPVTLDAATALFTFVPTTATGDARPFPADGKPVPFPPKGRVRLVRGTYTVRVFARGEEKATAVWPAQVFGEAPVTIAIPTRVPEDMVYCPPATPNGEGLFVDRTEVTVDQVEAVDGPALGDVAKEGRSAFEDPKGAPAWFYDEGVARAFEKASGKRIPTVQQWLHAAFGADTDAQRKYPWGNDAPDASRAYVAPDDTTALPRKAGGRDGGASPYGIEDMAGNLTEWVRNGTGDSLWVLGGHHMMTVANLASIGGSSPVRKPMPGHEAYTAMPGEEKNSWQAYRLKNGPNDNLPYIAGLRMVVPVK